MSKPIFNTGERRGMIVVIIVLAVLIAVAFVVNHRSTAVDETTKEQTDSVVKALHTQVANQKSTATEDKTKAKKEKNKKTKKSVSSKKAESKKAKNSTKQNTKTKSNHIERDMLGDALPKN